MVASIFYKSGKCQDLIADFFILKHFNFKSILSKQLFFYRRFIKLKYFLIY